MGKQITVSGNGLYVLGCNRYNYIYYRKGLNGRWKRLYGRAKYISVSWDSSHIWAVNRHNNLYYRNGLYGKWVYVSGKLKQICVLNNGLIWGVNSRNYVYVREKKIKGKRKRCPKKLPRNGRCNHKSSLQCRYNPMRCCGRGKRIYTLTAVCRRGRWLKMMMMVHCRCRSVCKRVQAKQRRRCGRRLGCFIVQCNRDGSFKPMQCHGSTGYCWCVDTKGRKKSRAVNMRGRRRNLRCGGKKGRRKKCPKKLPRNGRCNHKSSLRCNYHPIRCCG